MPDLTLTRDHLARMRAAGESALLVWDEQRGACSVVRADTPGPWHGPYRPVLAGARALAEIEAEAATKPVADTEARVCDRLQTLAESALADRTRLRVYTRDLAALRSAMVAEGMRLDGPPLCDPAFVPGQPARPARRVRERYRHPDGAWVVVTLAPGFAEATRVRVFTPPHHDRAEFHLDTHGLDPDAAADTIAAAACAAARRFPVLDM